jgi:hypothetical protein
MREKWVHKILGGSAGPTEPPLLAYRFEWGGPLKIIGRVKILNPEIDGWIVG